MKAYKKHVTQHFLVLGLLLLVLWFDHRPWWAWIGVPLCWAAFFPSKRYYLQKSSTAMAVQAK